MGGGVYRGGGAKRVKYCMCLMIEIFVYLQVANSSSKLRFEANLSREDSQSAKQLKAKEDF